MFSHIYVIVFMSEFLLEYSVTYNTYINYMTYFSRVCAIMEYQDSKNQTLNVYWRQDKRPFSFGNFQFYIFP